VASSIVVAITLWVRVVKNIIWLLHIHRQRAETPFFGIRRERKLKELKVSASKVRENRSRLKKSTLSAIEGP
jgi:hypothetical protein